MLLSQLMTGNILKPEILSAIQSVPREMFVPAAMKHAAYVDDDIELAQGRYLCEPLVFARLIDLAQIKPEHTVLDVAAANGYSAAVISHLAARVVVLEENKDLAETARASLASLNVQNTQVVTASLTAGYSAGAPYDVIIIEGAVHFVPPALAAQLAEGGRIVTVENRAARPGTACGIGKAVVYRKIAGKLNRTEHFDASVPLLSSFTTKTGFVF